MQRIKYPPVSEWAALQQRHEMDERELFESVKEVLHDVREEGDEAVRRYGERFDKIRIAKLQVAASEIQEAAGKLPDALKEAIQTALKNIEMFHAAQQIEEKRVETMPGVICWQRAVPIERVGLYIPGGTAPLFSTVLMLAVPARLAGCKEIVLCTPPGKGGEIHPAILYAAQLSGVTHLYKVGGIQAIGAMAYGTETIPKVDKIFGPGNQYVVAAKQLVSLREVAIDMPAGPSEVAIIADESADASFIASDLLSQAEHGVDSQSLLLTTSATLSEEVIAEVDRQLQSLPRREVATQSLKNSRIILLREMNEIIAFCNQYAPEHLIIQTKAYVEIATRITNAGSVFLGAYTPESAGDYASGTNHTLPTKGYAKAYSGVNLDSFIKKITFQEISREGLRLLGPTIEVMAEHELLDAHKRAVTIRLNHLQASE